MRENVKIVLFGVACIFLLLLLPGCRRGRDSDDAVSVLVFIPGVVAGSPTYEMMVEGALEFARETEGLQIRVFEAGHNQAMWEEQLMAMVAEGGYDLVLSSNPALPEIAASVGRVFPSQKFVITDAYYGGNPQIMTYLFNQFEQALFLGYLAGLVSTSDMPHANSARRIGFIAAQEFPLLTRHMVPGFIEGARRVDPAIELDFRVIGNWFDAGAASELAQGMINAGVDVFTSIAGGATQGMIHAIRDRGAYAVFFNNNEYAQALGLVVGSGLIRQRELTKEILANFLEGNIQFGTARAVGVREGYIDFIFDDPGFRDHVPMDIQERLEAFMDDFRAGRVEFTVPPL
ncbi:MAG: BMP family ABC transporter substrate-binding protein [Treponema sp.]|nr:BMP family ABC transporter substrate-binding protein [Treponema sp.]